MFPQLRQHLGPALDLIVEFSTLGEYRLDANGIVRPASALAHAPEHAPQLGGAGESLAGRAAVRRIVAGGAAGITPAATPAARRLGRDLRAAEAAKALACRGERKHARIHAHAEGTTARPTPRPRVAPAGEQLCFAV